MRDKKSRHGSSWDRPINSLQLILISFTYYDTNGELFWVMVELY